MTRLQQSPALSVQGTGMVYRNPAPHLCSKHAYYPSIVPVGGHELLASFVIGSAMESLDCQLHLARSADGGETWEAPVPLRTLPAGRTETGRLLRSANGEVVMLVSESERPDPQVGATNPANLGHVPTHLWLMRSSDGGRTFAAPQRVEPPIVGPTFELCSPIVELSDGTWLLPTSTWRGWDGWSPNGMKAVAFVSRDRGRSWPGSIDVMDGTRDGVLFWEQKIIEIDRGRLLSVAWAYEEAARRDRMNHFAVANRETLQFSSPRPTPLHGQTPALLHLGEGRVLCVYRRVHQLPGLWACIAQIDEAGEWHTLDEQCLWRPASTPPARSEGITLTESFRALRVGAPSLLWLGREQPIFLSFWAVEDCVANIRWVRLAC